MAKKQKKNSKKKQQKKKNQTNVQLKRETKITNK
jgi:hypothetical protein